MTTYPERPIRQPSDDMLNQNRFVERLAASLIDESTGKSTGVVVGLTGPWGIGKSSILNLLEYELTNPQNKTRYNHAVVVRFEPWLVSGREDLILEFFRELNGTINEIGTANAQHIDSLRALTSRLSRYAARLAPFAAIFSGTSAIGPVASKGLEELSSWLEPDTSLSGIRARIRESLEGVSRPIVVLIDDIDRLLEDKEVRTIAQLVRSVADFPAISYLLAYDPAHVVNALGGQSRGEQYLEKIVQLQIPMSMSPNFIERMLKCEIGNLVESTALVVDWPTNRSFHSLMNIALPQIVSTVRDVKRLVGTFRALEPMVRGEVYWVDIVAWCLLLVKSPLAIKAIRGHVDEIITNSSDAVQILHSASDEQGGKSQWQKNIVSDIFPDSLSNAKLISLLEFMFPVLGEDRRDLGRGGEHPDAIQFRRPLLTILELGLMDGAISRSEIINELCLDPTTRLDNLRRRINGPNPLEFIDRFADVFPSLNKINDLALWLDIAEALDRREMVWQQKEDHSIVIVERFAQVLWKELQSCSGNKLDMLQELVKSGCITLPAEIIRNLLRLDVWELGDLDISRDEIEAVGQLAGSMYVVLHKKGNLLCRLRTATPLFLLLDLSLWTVECEHLALKELEATEAIVAISLLLFGRGYSVGAEVPNRLFGAGQLIRMVSCLIESGGHDLEASASEALHKCARRLNRGH